jgi:branched-chain amino acid transport system substrate-binding protein
MRRLTPALILVSVVLAGGCSRKLMVGVVLPETGEAAVYGASIKSGVKLAFDQAFAAHTAPQGLVVEYRDSGSDPTRAASEAQALYSDGALVVIGGATSAEARAMIPVADREQRVLISPSASAPGLARQSVYFFRLYPSDDLEGVKAADLLVLTRKVETILVVKQDNEYTRGLLPVFMGELKQQHGELVGTATVGDPDWKQQVRDLLAARQPQGVFLVGYGDAVIAALGVLRDAGYKGTICTTSAINTAAFLEKAGSLAEGVFFPLAALDTSSDKEPVRSFVRTYYETYHLVPDIYAAHGFDSALTTLYAFAGLTSRSGREVQLRIKGNADKRGVTGPLAFDDYGNIKHYLRDHWIHHGKVEDYDTYVEREKDKLRDQMMRLLQGGS